jgi:t-SNARE complex subunit (syntaxin)
MRRWHRRESHWTYRWREFKDDWRSWILVVLIIIVITLVVMIWGKP